MNTLFLFTKPAVPGRCKTRLIGELTAEEAADLHAAFRDDVAERLARGSFLFMVAWALDNDESLPPSGVPGERQRGDDLGERLYNALAGAPAGAAGVVGSDHPELALETVEKAFQHLANGTDLVLGPAADGGYYLVAVRTEKLHRELFEGIPWSTEKVFDETMRRADKLGLRTELLPVGHDVDHPEDLERLVERLRDSPRRCPRTRRLLSAWGRLEIME